MVTSQPVSLVSGFFFWIINHSERVEGRSCVAMDIFFPLSHTNPSKGQRLHDVVDVLLIVDCPLGSGRRQRTTTYDPFFVGCPVLCWEKRFVVFSLHLCKVASLSVTNNPLQRTYPNIPLAVLCRDLKEQDSGWSECWHWERLGGAMVFVLLLSMPSNASIFWEEGFGQGVGKCLHMTRSRQDDFFQCPGWLLPSRHKRLTPWFMKGCVCLLSGHSVTAVIIIHLPYEAFFGQRLT